MMIYLHRYYHLLCVKLCIKVPYQIANTYKGGYSTICGAYTATFISQQWRERKIKTVKNKSMYIFSTSGYSHWDTKYVGVTLQCIGSIK